MPGAVKVIGGIDWVTVVVFVLAQPATAKTMVTRETPSNNNAFFAMPFSPLLWPDTVLFPALCHYSGRAKSLLSDYMNLFDTAVKGNYLKIVK
jgi:hypothetical protein